MNDGTTATSNTVATGPVLEALYAATDVAILIVQPTVVDDATVDGTVVWHNAAATRLDARVRVGVTAVDLFGPTVGEWQLATGATTALAEPGRTVHLGSIGHEADGATRYFDVALRAHEGLVVLEITDRTELAASEARFREMLDGLEAGAVLLAPILDEHGTIVDATVMWANRASEGMWTDKHCLHPGTLVSSSYYDAAEWTEAANEAWQHHPVRRMLDPHPTRTPWTAAIEVLRRVGDTLLEFTVDRSSDEALLTQLDELDHRFALLLAELPLTVVAWQVDHDDLEFVSPNIAELTGYPASDLTTRRSLERLVHPDDLPSREALSRFLDDGEGHFDDTWRVLRADGSQILCSVRAVRRFGPSGVRGVVVLLNDVTEQRRLLDRAESSERLRSLGRTAGSIAHDFNNLLMIVSGNIERARHQSAVDLPALATAAAAAQRAGDLAQSLLSFARGRPGSPRPLDLGEVVRGAQAIAQATVGSRTKLLVTIDDLLPEVFADPTHIEQILLNLVTNARDALDAGGTIAVEVFGVNEPHCHLDDVPTDGGAWVAISVSDTGQGIAPELQLNVWEPYFSSKELSRDSGSGLGLSTVHGLVHQYGGHAALESEPGTGTSVTVYLPAVPR